MSANDERAERAREMRAVFAESVSDDPADVSLGDMIADILHLAYQDHDGTDDEKRDRAERVHTMGMVHFEEEREEASNV